MTTFCQFVVAADRVNIPRSGKHINSAFFFKVKAVFLNVQEL